MGHIPKHAQWPSDTDIHSLVTKSSGLFIYASTILNFIEMPQKLPEDQLKIVLNIEDEPSTSPLDSLHQLYQRILFEAPYTRLTRTVVESIVLLVDPLSLMEIEDLLKLKRGEGSLSMEGLHSIFIVPEEVGTSVRIFHASLYEFFTDSRYQHKYSIDCQEHHTRFTGLCLEILLKNLRRDICNMGLDNTGQEENDGLQSHSSTIARRYRREESISGALRYACRYWAKHLSSARFDSAIFDSLETFANRFLLYWIEALSLVGDLESTIPSLQDACQWLQKVSRASCLRVHQLTLTCQCIFSRIAPKLLVD